MSYEPVRWGILSTARINRHVIPPGQASPKVDIVAVASRDDAHARSYAREWGIERTHGDYEALLADPEVEAIYISLPNLLHTKWSIRALETGKHVLCEKPLSRRAADVENAFDAAERCGRFLMEAFMYRHNPQTRKLTELMAAGAIGSVQLIRSVFSYPLYDDENVRMQRDLDGGALMDIGCYCVSGSRLLAGEPERAYGEQVVGPTGVDTRFYGTLRFPGGVVAQFDCGMVLPNRDELEVIGDQGSLFLDDPWHCRAPRIELRRDDTVERIPIRAEDSYGLELENLSDAIRGTGTPLLGRDDAVANARAIEALYRSAETVHPVTLES
ncbi:MAG: gfo/Idh/MocA family oxidoreductase [Propionibacteriales bacterium]|nr:gfo/Idh/MocA family oxidoreductase [Propionibacteriales bacterium]